jgi:hypothetical protein
MHGAAWVSLHLEVLQGKIHHTKQLQARLRTIMRNGSCRGLAVISMRMRHMEALMRIRPPRKLAAPSSAYMPTWLWCTIPSRTCRSGRQADRHWHL